MLCYLFQARFFAKNHFHLIPSMSESIAENQFVSILSPENLLSHLRLYENRMYIPVCSLANKKCSVNKKYYLAT